MTPSTDTVQSYYDAHVAGKLRGWLMHNRRVAMAWQTVTRWAPPAPARILEVGCGIGDITWRLHRKHPAALVIGLDISPKSIDIAQKLFRHPQVQFVAGTLDAVAQHGPFDLIVGLDVYEHIANADRPAFDALLGRLLQPHGRIVLSVPTPRHQQYYRQHRPAALQPVDEDIPLETLQALAARSGTEVRQYQEVDVWGAGDYAHAVLAGPDEPWTAYPLPEPMTILARIGRKVLDALRQPLVALRLWQARRRLGL